MSTFQRNDGKWVKYSEPLRCYELLSVADFPTCLASIARLPIHEIQRIQDPDAVIHYISKLDHNNFMCIEDQSLRSNMETFVAAHSKNSILMSKGRAELDTVNHGTIEHITQTAFDYLCAVVSDCNNSTTDRQAAYVDISMATIVAMMVSNKKRAAQDHLRAWIGMLHKAPHIVRAFDMHLDEMIYYECDRRTLQKLELISSELRRSREEAREEARAHQEEIRTLLARLAERVDVSERATNDQGSEILNAVREQHASINRFIEQTTTRALVSEPVTEDAVTVSDLSPIEQAALEELSKIFVFFPAAKVACKDIARSVEDYIAKNPGCVLESYRTDKSRAKLLQAMKFEGDARVHGQRAWTNIALRNFENYRPPAKRARAPPTKKNQGAKKIAKN